MSNEKEFGQILFEPFDGKSINFSKWTKNLVRCLKGSVAAYAIVFGNEDLKVDPVRPDSANATAAEIALYDIDKKSVDSFNEKYLILERKAWDLIYLHLCSTRLTKQMETFVKLILF